MAEDQSGGNNGEKEVGWIRPVIGDDGLPGYELEDVARVLGMKGYRAQLREIEKQHQAERKAEQRAKRAPGLNGDLSGGMERDARPRDIDAVAAGCPFIAHTLATGGKELVGEKIWHELTAVAHYCADPEGTVVRLIEKNPSYNFDTAMLKLNEVRKYREDNPKLGYPRCATLDERGAKPWCEKCDYRKEDKWPLSTPEAKGQVKPGEPVSEAARDLNYGRIPEVLNADGRYQPIPGGYYDANDENVERLNRRVCRLGGKNADTMIIENLGPEKFQWKKPQAVELAWAGAHVKVTHESDKGPVTKIISLYKWWVEHPHKLPVARMVFMPREKPGHIGNDEFNMWSGWGVQPDDGHTSDPYSKLRPITNHIRDVICRGERERFEYTLKWMAWKVQHPELPSETAIVWRSKAEGTGKNMIANMFAELFGEHGQVFGDKRSVTGEHATNEYVVVGVLDEVLFYGDRQTTDLMKSLVTGKTRRINPKYLSERTIANPMSFIILSNHEVVVTLGKFARRHVIFDFDESKVGNFTYFINLQKAIDAGGAAQFLHFLLNLELPVDWHPRQIIHTTEVVEHQIAGMEVTQKWLLDGCDNERLAGDLSRSGLHGPAYDYIAPDGAWGWKLERNVDSIPLDSYALTTTLFTMLLGWAHSTRERNFDATNSRAFGRKLTEILGPHKRLTVELQERGKLIKKQLWAYKIPSADDLREQIYKAAGITLTNKKSAGDEVTHVS